MAADLSILPAAMVITQRGGRVLYVRDQGRVFGRFERAVFARHFGGLGLMAEPEH